MCHSNWINKYAKQYALCVMCVFLCLCVCELCVDKTMKWHTTNSLPVIVLHVVLSRISVVVGGICHFIKQSGGTI